MSEPSFPDELFRASPEPGLTDAPATPTFDRFYFSLHPPEAGFLLAIGGGVYPRAGLVDGYVVLSRDGVQRNLRLSGHHPPGSACGVGPLTWDVLESRRRWRLRLAANPCGVEFDLVWTARADAYETRRYEILDERGGSDHAHYFQPGEYRGELRLDGAQIDVTGWLGERDRSCGDRRVSDGLGLHLWVQAQFDDRTIGLLYNSDRRGRPVFCDGALIAADGSVRMITEVRHSLSFDGGFECISAYLELDLDDGGTRALEVRPAGPPIFMAGCGHSGWHGVDHGAVCVEHERWTHTAGLTPRTLPISLVQVPARFGEGSEVGSGVFEYAHTRSPAFCYAPTVES